MAQRGGNYYQAGHGGQDYDFMLPQSVKTFIKQFYSSVKNGDLQGAKSQYTKEFQLITERYFSDPAAPWPSAETVAPLCDNDKMFLHLYTELYYRHLFQIGQHNLHDMVDSWRNWCAFFQYILDNPHSQDYRLPLEWLYDIINEYVYQFQSFSQLRNKAATLSSDDREVRDNNASNTIELFFVFLRTTTTTTTIALSLSLPFPPPSFHPFSLSSHLSLFLSPSPSSSSLSLFKILMANTSAWRPSKVLETLGALADEAGEQAGDFQGDLDEGEEAISQPLAQLGYLSSIGKARVHIVLGDYRMVLASLAPIQLFEQGLFTRVTACHIMIYYCAGFAYMMLRRYVDASTCFRRILIFLSRTKNFQKREIQKKHDQIVSLLAMTWALCPGIVVEESVRELLNEQHGDKLARLQSGQLGVYRDLFDYACPKFISPSNLRESGSPAAFTQTVANIQCTIFLEEVKQRVQLATGTSYLKLYTMASMTKLAQLRGMSEADLRRSLVYIKNKMRSLTWEEGAPLSGVEKVHMSPNFYVQASAVKVEDREDGSEARGYGKYFINER